MTREQELKDEIEFKKAELRQLEKERLRKDGYQDDWEYERVKKIKLRIKQIRAELKGLTEEKAECLKDELKFLKKMLDRLCKVVVKNNKYFPESWHDDIEPILDDWRERIAKLNEELLGDKNVI